MNELQDFYFYKYNLVFTAKASGELPAFKGSLIRDFLGVVLKRQHCSLPEQKDCIHCPNKNTCVFAQFFVSVNTTDFEIIRGLEKKPAPYIIYCPDYRRFYRAGDKINVVLTLVGESVRGLTIFLKAFHDFRWLKKDGLKLPVDLSGVFEVTGIQGLNRCGFFDTRGGDFDESYVPKPFSWHPSHSDLWSPDTFWTTRLEFESKFRIRIQNNKNIIRDTMPFDIFFSRLHRRIKTLGIVYAGMPDIFHDFRHELDTVQVIEQDMRFVDGAKYSARQQKAVPQGGNAGYISYEGLSGDMLMYLLLGTQVHVGNNTSIGFGRYKLLIY